MNTIVFHPESDPAAIQEAAAILRRGGLVGIPTETVYGLGADALNEEAVVRIFLAKGRPQDNPLIIHVPDASWLEQYCRDVPPEAYRLAERFWPGPLTMILPRRDIVPLQTTGGLETVGVRCPDHPVTLAIIRAAGVPIAAPSGNTSGRPSPTTAAHMIEDMDGKIDGIVDGGPCTVGVESTIIDLTVTPPRLLRPGGLPLEALEEVLGEVSVDKAVTGLLAAGEHPRAPGMKYRHYAPHAPVTVVTGAPDRSARRILGLLSDQAGVICFDEYAPLYAGHIIHRLGPAADKSAQARHVFDALRTFDGTDVTEIFAQCPDDRGLGLAVANRLKKAAGFHLVDADRPILIGRGRRSPWWAAPAREKPAPWRPWRTWAARCWTATPCITRCSARTPPCGGPSKGSSARCLAPPGPWTGRSWGTSCSPTPPPWGGSTPSCTNTCRRS